MTIAYILSLLVLLLLCIGAVWDIKRRAVPVVLMLAIVCLSVPLIWVNLPYLENTAVMFTGLMGLMYVIGNLGTGDLVLLPIILSVSNIQIFLIGFTLIGFGYMIFKWTKTNIPYYVPITGAYIGVMLFG